MDFMSAYLAGWSVLSLMCLIIGLGLMIAEMFTPGLGLMGMFGIIALIAAIVLSAHSLLDAIFTLAIIFVCCSLRALSYTAPSQRAGWQIQALCLVIA